MATGRHARGSGLNWRGARWFALGLFLIGCRLGAATPPRAFSEYQIKAVFLFNFTQFVDWPPAAFPNESAPVIIGVLGDDPFGTDLDEAVRDEKVGQRPLEIRRFRRVEEIAACHILYISRSETARLERVLSSLRGRSILTVSDVEEFSQRGGMIRFLTENNKVRMRINPDAAKREGLTISSKLLRPAEIYTQKEARR